MFHSLVGNWIWVSLFPVWPSKTTTLGFTVWKYYVLLKNNNKQPKPHKWSAQTINTRCDHLKIREAKVLVLKQSNIFPFLQSAHIVFFFWHIIMAAIGHATWGTKWMAFLAGSRVRPQMTVRLLWSSLFVLQTGYGSIPCCSQCMWIERSGHDYNSKPTTYYATLNFRNERLWGLGLPWIHGSSSGSPLSPNSKHKRVGCADSVGQECYTAIHTHMGPALHILALITTVKTVHKSWVLNSNQGLILAWTQTKV